MLTLLMGLALAQSDVQRVPDGQVVAATLFSDRATVTRELRVSLEPGENEVVFADLPANLDAYTLQADGAGDAVIRGLSVQRVELANDRRQRVESLQDQILALQDQRQESADDKAAADAELAFLRSLGAASAGQLSAELLFSPDTTSDADALASLLRQRITDALGAVRVANIAMRGVDASISALQRELRGVQGSPQWARHEVTVLVQAESANTGTVRLTYTVPGASWTPIWDARADLGGDTLSMTLFAHVVQTTGEDWSSAELTLSTARPSAGVMAPALSPFWLQAQYYAVSERASRSRAPAPMAMAPMEEMEEDMDGDYNYNAPMLVQEAQVVSQAVASTFVVPGGVSITGDGTRRKVQVTTVEVPSVWTHVAVPLLDQRAWLVSEGTWPETWSLLGGVVNVFAADSFVGSMSLPTVGTGSTFELGFGPDDAVVVERVVVEDLRRGPGFLRKPSVTRQWATTVSNHRDEPVSVSLRDRLPVATDSKWRVDVLGEEPDVLGDEGLVRWERDVAPSGTFEVSSGWRVRFPKNNVPGGL